MPFPLERLDESELSALVRHFVEDVDVQTVSYGDERYAQNVQGIGFMVEPLGLDITMARTEWTPRGRFAGSRVGRLLLGKGYPDIHLKVEDIYDPSESRVFTAREGYVLLPVYVEQGVERPIKRPATHDDLVWLNTKLRWMAHLESVDDR